MALRYPPAPTRSREASRWNADIIELQTVMRVIDALLDEAVAAMPPDHLPLLPNALLNLAIERMLAARTPASIATILYRLADLIGAGERPEGSHAFPLTGHDA
jgi:trans-aconitate methyltransferase